MTTTQNNDDTSKENLLKSLRASILTAAYQSSIGGSPIAAMQYSQAALNLAHAAAVVHQMK